VSELPWHRVTWQQSAEGYESGLFTDRRETIDHVLERIRRLGPHSTRDFEQRTAIDWWWGPTNEIRAVLEALATSGRLGLARREGNRRYYDLAERLFPAELLAREVDPREQWRHKLLSRYRAHGLLGTGGTGDVWMHAYPRKRAGVPQLTKRELHAELVEAGELVPVAIESVKGTRYVLRDEEPLLGEPGEAPPAVAFLAPLDAFVWDRQFLRALFGFDYVWEVYVPERKRRWGYYVLPILFADRLVGRIEPRIDRAGGAVRVLGLWWEDGFRPRRAEGFVDAMREALAAYLEFAGARRLDWPPQLGAAKRLFGARPQSTVK
jgi:uncharacterized protein